MKLNFVFISVCLFITSLVLSTIFLDVANNLYEKIFNPNYGWWGSPEIVTFPSLYSFFIVLLFVLWARKNYYYGIIVFLFPAWYLLITSMIGGFGTSELEIFSALVLMPSILAFVVAKLIRKVVFRFRSHNLPMVINK